MKENTFRKNVITLMLGTGAAQVITFLAAFIVTRLYSPEDFTSLEQYAMILAVLSVFSTFKMELAIVQAKTDKEARSLAKWCISTSTKTSIICLIGVVVFNEQIAIYFQNDYLRWFVYLIPLNLFLFGAYQVLVYWHHRNAQFKVSSYSKILFNSSNEGSKISLGLLGIKPLGLILSNLLARLVSVVYLLKKTNNSLRFREISKEETVTASRKFSEYYRYSVWSSFLGKLATWAHIILISHFFGLLSIGFFALSRRLVLTPLSVFSQSFAQVFYQRISTLSDTSEIRTLFFKFFFRLLGISILMVVVVLLVPNEVYALALGEKWEFLGDYMRLLIFWFALNFITSCLAFVNYRLKKQRAMLALDFLHFVLVVGSICYGFYSGKSEWETLQLFVIGKVIFFIINICAMVYFVLSSQKFKLDE